MPLKHKPAMRGEEFRAIRQQLHLTQKEIAPKLGVHWNTVARWEREVFAISGPAARLMQSILESRQYAHKVLDK